MSIYYAYRPNHQYLGTLSATDQAAAVMLATVVYGPEILILSQPLSFEHAAFH